MTYNKKAPALEGSKGLSTRLTDNSNYTTDNPFEGIKTTLEPLRINGLDHELGFYENHHKGSPQKLINLVELGGKIASPESMAKNRLPLITPHSATGKTAEAAKHANYEIAVIDYDGVKQSAADIVIEITSHGYQGAILYYTTSSHGSTKDKHGQPKHPNHYKFVIPFDRPVDGETYHKVTTGLSLLLGADLAQGRQTQGFYAPNRATSGKPYEGETIGLGDGFLTPDCQLYKAAIASYEQQRQAEVATPKPRPSLSQGQDGIIELIKQAYSIQGLIESQGHQRRGNKWLSPNSSSGIAGGLMLPNERFYSFHGPACPLSRENHVSEKNPTKSYSLDVADVLCALRYNGDFNAMIAAEAQNLDPEGNKDRQRQEMARRERERNAQPAVDFDVVRQDLKTPEQPKDKRNQERIYRIIKDTAIGRRAKDLAQMVEMPTDTVCLAGLGVVSAIVAGARVIKRRDGYSTVPAGLYIAVEQPPSTGKSSIINGFRNPILKHLIDANKRFVQQTKDAAKEAGEEEPKFVQCLNLFQSNATPEAMEEIVANNNGLFSIVGDEQAAIDTLLGLTYGDKGNNNNGLILNGFAGEYFNSARVTRKGFNGVPYGGVTVMAQEGTARKIVQGSQGQGVVERFLLWNEPNLLGSRKRGFHELTTEEEYGQIASNLVKLALEQYKKEGEGIDALASLGLTRDGYKAIHALMQDIEPLLADDGKYSHPLLRGAAGKADMQVMKIAATLHMADESLALVTPDTMYWQPHYQIKDEYVKMAIEVVKVTLDQLIHTLETNGIIGRDSYMDALADYLEGKHKPLTARAIAQSQKNRPIFKNTGSPTKHINEALQRLVDIEVVTATQETIGGKPQTVYKMH